MKSFLKKFIQNKLAVLGGLIILIQIVLIIAAPLIVSYPPHHQIPGALFLPPGTEGHLLGTDDVGRDVFSRIVYGTRLTYLIGFSVLLICLSAGIPIGLISGYNSRLDNLLMRLMEVLLAFPPLFLALAITVVLGRGLNSVILAVGFGSIPIIARLVRSTVLMVKNKEYVLAARALGASDFRIIFRHILPNCLAPLIVQSTFRVATAILSAAALSFLGVGVQPPLPEWGSMLGRGRAFIFISPHISIIPGLAIFSTVLAFNLVGDALRDIFDPKMKR